MKAKFPLSLRQRLSASPALRSLRKRQSIQTDPLQTDFSVDLTCCAARHAPYCGGLLCVGASCYCASCATQSNPRRFGTRNQPTRQDRPRGRRECWSCPRRHPRLRCCLDEVAHAAAEEVPPRALVLHVIVDLGDGGVRALSVVELFVARGSQELHLARM